MKFLTISVSWTHKQYSLSDNYLVNCLIFRGHQYVRYNFFFYFCSFVLISDNRVVSGAGSSNVVQDFCCQPLKPASNVIGRSAIAIYGELSRTEIFISIYIPQLIHLPGLGSRWCRNKFLTLWSYLGKKHPGSRIGQELDWGVQKWRWISTCSMDRCARPYMSLMVGQTLVPKTSQFAVAHVTKTV